jgi:hypothetical protein
MAESPESADQRGSAGTALLADNSSYRDHVIRIGSMPHAQKKSDGDDGK